MKHMKWFSVLGIVMFLLAITGNIGYGQEAEMEKDMAADMETNAEAYIDYVWGIVIRVSDQQIVVSEYDYETEEEIEVAYKIDPAVQLENVASLAEIQADDLVELSIVEKNGEEVVMAIMVDRILEGEGGEEMEPIEEEYQP